METSSGILQSGKAKQWGYTSTGSATFPIKFSQVYQCINQSGPNNGGDSNADLGISDSKLTTTGFTVNNTTYAKENRYIAVGKG